MAAMELVERRQIDCRYRRRFINVRSVEPRLLPTPHTIILFSGSNQTELDSSTAQCRTGWFPSREKIARRTFYRRLLLEYRAVTLSIQENARHGRKVNFAPDRIPLGGKNPKNV